MPSARQFPAVRSFPRNKNRRAADAPASRGTAGVVTAISPEDGKLTVLTGEDERIGCGFDERDELATLTR